MYAKERKILLLSYRKQSKMFRIPGKEGSPAEKEAEKARAKQQVKQQFFLFVGIVALLRVGMLCVFMFILLAWEWREGTLAYYPGDVNRRFRLSN